MPSIPQSLLWISLVVLWLFVLVPMLINKRDTVRRTSDVALATRVLNTKSRLIRRAGPAAGHRHDPTWLRDEDELDPTFDAAVEADLENQFESRFVADNPPADESLTEQFVVAEYSTEETVEQAGPVRARTRSLVVLAAVAEQTDSDYLDVDFIEENSGALPVGDLGGVQGSLFDAEPESFVEAEPEPADTVFAEETVASAADDVGGEVRNDGGAGKEYEYVEDSSGLEAAEEPADSARFGEPVRRRRLDSTATAAAVSARKYRFRKRVLTGLAAIVVLSAVLASTVDSAFWWSCGATGVVTVLYLGYLRRQTRIEEQVRRRRQQRVGRSRPAGEEAVVERVVQRDRPDFDVFPTRLQRPGSVVLDIDDEDPVFEHLDEVAYSPRYHHDLPRASGQ